MKKYLIILAFLVSCTIEKEDDIELKRSMPILSAIDIAIYNPVSYDGSTQECGDIIIKARPNYTFSNMITNIQFCVRWDNTDIEITKFVPNFQLEEGWGTGINGGYRYFTFVTLGFYPVVWQSGKEYELVRFTHSTSDDVQYCNFIITNDDWAEQHNSLTYFEVWGTDRTGYIYHQANGTYIGGCE
jgi:hypothetical protein